MFFFVVVFNLGVCFCCMQHTHTQTKSEKLTKNKTKMKEKNYIQFCKKNKKRNICMVFFCFQMQETHQSIIDRMESLNKIMEDINRIKQQFNQNFERIIKIDTNNWRNWTVDDIINFIYGIKDEKTNDCKFRKYCFVVIFFFLCVFGFKGVCASYYAILCVFFNCFVVALFGLCVFFLFCFFFFRLFWVVAICTVFVACTYVCEKWIQPNKNKTPKIKKVKE